MNDTLSVTVYVILDDLLRAMEHRTDPYARTSDSEMLTVGVIAACQFANHHERPLCILHALAGALWAVFGWRLHLVVTTQGAPVSLCRSPYVAFTNRLADGIIGAAGFWP